MKRNSIFRRLARALSRRQALSLSPAIYKTGRPAVDAKIALAIRSGRPRYRNPKEIEPYVRAVRAHQLATRGSIPGIYRHPKGK